MISAGLTNTTRKAVYKRDNYACALCDSTRGLQIHHVMKRSQGGSSHPHNLITLCERCHNMAHGTHYPDQPNYINAESMELDCVQYVSDFYAEQGEEWNPWKYASWMDGKPLD